MQQVHPVRLAPFTDNAALPVDLGAIAQLHAIAQSGDKPSALKAVDSALRLLATLSGDEQSPQATSAVA